MNTDADGFEILDPAACRALLGSVRLGRLAVSHQALPIVLPVAFVAVDNGVAVDASSEIVRRAANAQDVVCLQADGLDAAGLFWNVTATGRLAPDELTGVVVPAMPWGASGDPPRPRADPVWLSIAIFWGRRTTGPLVA